MKRTLCAGVTLALTAMAVVVLSGCSAPTQPQMDTSKVWGYVAAADKAQIEVADAQDGVTDLLVRRVLAPTDAWVVVHSDMDGQPGARVGLTHVNRGETLDVKVRLTNLTTPKVIVALHADKGAPNQFDFDMMNKEMSADRPYFVNGSELATAVTVRQYGVEIAAQSASVVASEQVGASTRLIVSRVLAPMDAWVVVHIDKDGAPGERVGLAHVSAGETVNLAVPLQALPLTPNLLVALHADKGDAGLFNFSMDDKLNSTDQPFFMEGKEVAIAVRVK